MRVVKDFTACTKTLVPSDSFETGVNDRTGDVLVSNVSLGLASWLLSMSDCCVPGFSDVKNLAGQITSFCYQKPLSLTRVMADISVCLKKTGDERLCKIAYLIDLGRVVNLYCGLDPLTLEGEDGKDALILAFDVGVNEETSLQVCFRITTRKLLSRYEDMLIELASYYVCFEGNELRAINRVEKRGDKEVGYEEWTNPTHRVYDLPNSAQNMFVGNAVAIFPTTLTCGSFPRIGGASFGSTCSALKKLGYRVYIRAKNLDYYVIGRS